MEWDIFKKASNQKLTQWSSSESEEDENRLTLTPLRRAIKEYKITTKDGEPKEQASSEWIKTTRDTKCLKEWNS